MKITMTSTTIDTSNSDKRKSAARLSRGDGNEWFGNHRLTASTVVTDPAGTPPLSGSAAAGHVTRIVASEVVCGGWRHVRDLCPKHRVCRRTGDVRWLSFVREIHRVGRCYLCQWPFKLDQSQGSFGSGGSGQAFEVCPGGSRTSARRKEEICEIIWLAVVC